MALYLALEEVLEKETEYDNIVLIRSAVATREQGFQPGTKEEKENGSCRGTSFEISNNLRNLCNLWSNPLCLLFNFRSQNKRTAPL